MAVRSSYLTLSLCLGHRLRVLCGRETEELGLLGRQVALWMEILSHVSSCLTYFASHFYGKMKYFMHDSAVKLRLFQEQKAMDFCVFNKCTS